MPVNKGMSNFAFFLFFFFFFKCFESSTQWSLKNCLYNEAVELMSMHYFKNYS